MPVFQPCRLVPTALIAALALIVIGGAQMAQGQAVQRLSPPNPVPHPHGSFSGSIAPAAPSALETAHALARQAQASAAPLFTGSIGGSASTAARALEPIVQALANDEGQRAYALAQAIGDATTRDLGLWLIARTRADDLPLELRTAFRDTFSGWPGAGIIAQQTETAMLARYGHQTPPLSLFGTSNARTPAAQLAQAQALAQAGRTEDARRIASALWRSDVLDDGLEARLLSSLGSLLTQEDHRHRAHWLLYRDRVTGAERVAQYLPAADQNAIAVRGRAIRDGASARDLVRRAHDADPGNIHITFEFGTFQIEIHVWHGKF